MNERIQELAAQAGVTGYFAAGTEYATPIPLTPELQKFTELIMMDCAEHLYTNGGAFLVQGLKQHFGVE